MQSLITAVTAAASSLDPSPSPSRPQSVSDADDALLVEVAAEEDLLEAFYSFMYEGVVLVGGGGGGCSSSSLTKEDSGGEAGARSTVHASASSPRRGEGGSPRKNLIAGPTATHLASSATPPQLTREIMSAMLPSKSWSDASGKWQRMVKLTQATRTEVVQLEDALDRLLVTHQARATAICHVREKFLLQVFGACVLDVNLTSSIGGHAPPTTHHCFALSYAEELIREVSCECPERDELRLTIVANQTLYHNSISYGRKKAVQAEVGIADLETEIQRLELRREQLQKRKNQLTHNELFLDELFLDEERHERLAQQEQTRQFLQTQRLELETFYRELAQDTSWM